MTVIFSYLFLSILFPFTSPLKHKLPRKISRSW